MWAARPGIGDVKNSLSRSKTKKTKNLINYSVPLTKSNVFTKDVRNASSKKIASTKLEDVASATNLAPISYGGSS